MATLLDKHATSSESDADLDQNRCPERKGQSHIDFQKPGKFFRKRKKCNSHKFMSDSVIYDDDIEPWELCKYLTLTYNTVNKQYKQPTLHQQLQQLLTFIQPDGVPDYFTKYYTGENSSWQTVIPQMCADFFTAKGDWLKENFQVDYCVASEAEISEQLGVIVRELKDMDKHYDKNYMSAELALQIHTVIERIIFDDQRTNKTTENKLQALIYSMLSYTDVSYLHNESYQFNLRSIPDRPQNKGGITLKTKPAITLCVHRRSPVLESYPYCVIEATVIQADGDHCHEEQNKTNEKTNSQIFADQDSVGSKCVQKCTPISDKGVQKCTPISDKGVQKCTPISDKGVQKCIPISDKDVQKCTPISDKGVQKCTPISDKGVQKCTPISDKGVQKCMPISDKGVHKGTPISDKDCKTDLCNSSQSDINSTVPIINWPSKSLSKCTAKLTIDMYGVLVQQEKLLPSVTIDNCQSLGLYVVNTTVYVAKIVHKCTNIEEIVHGFRWPIQGPKVIYSHSCFDLRRSNDRLALLIFLYHYKVLVRFEKRVF